MTRVLIAGCGYVGTELGARLTRAGHSVWGLRRGAHVLPQALKPISADLGQKDSLRWLPADLDHVVYAAGADHSDDESYRRAYVLGLSNLLESIDRTNLKRVIFTSSTAVYSQNDGSWVNEASPSEASGFAGRRLLEAEAVLRASGLPFSILRFGGIYGPGRTRLLESVRRGEASFDPEAPQYTNRIHRDDCAGAIQHLLSIDAPAELYLGVDDDPVDRKQLLEWLACRLGAPKPPARVSAKPPRAGSKRCSNARLKQSGYSFEYPSFRAGYGAVLAEGRTPTPPIELCAE